MDNLYKNNLLVLKDIDENGTIYYIDNTIFKDDRLFSGWRRGNNLLKIAEIIKYSFIHYFNLIMINSENIDEETQTNLINLLRQSHLGLIQLNRNLLTYETVENRDKISILVVLFKELLINLDNNIQNRKLEEQNNVKNEVIDIQPKGIESIINMEGLSNVYTNLGNNLKDCEKCVEYEDCENCEDCVENKDLCPNIIDEETKEDCKKYTNDSIIFNTFRVIKKKVYKFFVYVGKSIYDFFY